jgi:predicted phosphodiesterase
MRVAVLADIHGNLPAAEAVLEDVRRQSPDFVVAAGDLALRGAHPAETVDLLFSSCHALLMGNTDAYLAGVYLNGAYQDREHWKTELLSWTRDQLGPQRVARLAGLAFSVRYVPRRGQDLFVCHANPGNLEESLEPTLDEPTIRRYLANVDAAAVAFGHLHFPYRRRVGRMVIADVASAGIPRDGDLRPAWGLFSWTPRGWRVQIRRVRYQVRRATQALIDRKVPGAPLLVHKMLEALYRHHGHLVEAARRHSGLPPYLKPPLGNLVGTRALGISRTPLLPPPPMLMPPPGQATQLDEDADELLGPAALATAPDGSADLAPPCIGGEPLADLAEQAAGGLDHEEDADPDPSGG